jgi:hypothetical protein
MAATKSARGSNKGVFQNTARGFFASALSSREPGARKNQAIFSWQKVLKNSTLPRVLLDTPRRVEFDLIALHSITSLFLLDT